MNPKANQSIGEPYSYTGFAADKSKNPHAIVPEPELYGLGLVTLSVVVFLKGRKKWKR